MKVVAPQPFTYYGEKKAVLLLHGFTGSTVDVRKLGVYLNERGFTCHAPLYKGHGVTPNELIKTGPKEWWQDVVRGYQFLKEEGYEAIAVAGVSLGGVFSLKVGAEFPVKGIVSMSAPAQEKNTEDLYKRVINYARGFKKFEGKDEEQIAREMMAFEQTPMKSLKNLQQLILETRDQIHSITSPIAVLQGRLDDPLYHESAQYIFTHVASSEKQIKWYEHSGHLLTLDKEREQVFEDVYQFLNQLNW